MEDLLVQLELNQALEEKLDGTLDKQWLSLEKKACAMIRGCLSDVALYSVIEERTPKGLWSKLHILYIGKNMGNKLMLKKRLYSLQMKEDENVVNHIQQFD